MQIDESTLLREVVVSNYHTADVFIKHGIDFCCSEMMTIEEACNRMNVALEILMPELKEVLMVRNPESDLVNRLAIHELVNHIVAYHHAYIRNTTPLVRDYLSRLTSDHSHDHPELQEVKSLFEHLVDNIFRNMEKEELVLFPRIRKLLIHQGPHDNSFEGRFTIGDSIRELESCQDNELIHLKRIARLTDNYTVPEGECRVYFITMKNLREFGDDFQRHNHLERNILFPKAIRLEHELLAEAEKADSQTRQ